MSDDSLSIAEGHHLALHRVGTWEFARRRRGRGVVAIVALTPDRRLVLVEQHRPPLGGPVIELPAGLIGDAPDRDGESMIEAAQRELLEETGFVSDRWSDVSIPVASSAGLTDEVVVMVGATDARRVAPGGGVDDECIRVHTVPLEDLAGWLGDRARTGVMADGRVWAAPTFAGRLT